MKEDENKIGHNTVINMLVVFTYCFTIACFTLLSLSFKNVWIMLLALLFPVSIKKDKLD